MYRFDNNLYFGSLSKRQLHLRWFVPYEFQDFTDRGFALSWRKLVNPRNWLRAIFRRSHWEFWWRRHTESTHRCYCSTGWSFDGGIRIAGWSLQWFYSHFTGNVPCPCDVYFDGEEEESEASHAS